MLQPTNRWKATWETRNRATEDDDATQPVSRPVRSDGNGQSFVGVVFDEAIVARVVITSGQTPLGAEEFDVSDGGNRDLVVFDDLLFGEPKAF
jgi:hypothetical protein